MKKTFSLFFAIFLVVFGSFCCVHYVSAADYLAEYWDTATVATPAMPGTPAGATTTISTSAIDFNWGDSAPIGTGDGFIARFTKTIGSGEYTFTMGSDDGTRLYIDGVRIINMWVDQGYLATTTTRTVTTSGNHDLKIEYYENGGGAQVYFSYQRTIYANSSTGNDTTGDGTAAAPYKTYTKAYSQAEAGDTIHATYSLAYSAGFGGTLTGSTTQVVASSSSGSAVTAVPNTGYHFVDWSDASTTNPRIDYGYNDVTVTANFATTTYTLTYIAGSGGTITGSSSQIIDSGANGSAVTAVPNTGYHFVNWDDASTTNPRTDYNITAAATIAANFSINTFTLSYAAGTGGSITGSALQTVNYNANGTAVTAVPASGYAFSRWSDGTTANPRTDTGVVANISVTASFSTTGSNSVVSAPSVGNGVVDVAIPMNEQRAISEIKPNGTNVLAYIGSTGGFNIAVSQTRAVDEHHFKIVNVDMINKKITVEIMSEPKIVELGVGETKKIDLDNDNVSDMSLSFNELLNNRIDLTIQQLAFVENKKEEAKAEVKPTAPAKQSTSYKFKRDLKYGMSGADVKELQKYLNANGFTVAKSGVGSEGKETTQFGPATKAALIRFQKAKKITPAVGYFGPVTRKVVSK